MTTTKQKPGPSPSGPVPPVNLEAEEHVLGAMLLSPAAVDAASEELTGREFYRESHSKIFAAMTALHTEGRPVDTITVPDRLDVAADLEDIGGRVRIHELASIVPAASNVRHWCRIVREMNTLRDLIRVGSEIQRYGYDRPAETEDLVESAEKLVFDMAAARSSSDFRIVAEDVQAAYKRLEELHRSGGSIIGVPSGFRLLDDITSGFQPGQLTVLAARPSMGKSALALAVCSHITMRVGLPVGLFTMEMSRSEVTQRILASEGLIDTQTIRNGKLGLEDWQRLGKVSSELEASPLFIEDAPAVTMGEMRSKARRLRLRQPKLALIVVDYLQLMGGPGDLYERVTENSRSMKALARELDVPVLALSQLSRAVEQRHDKRPMLSDLRESGAIEQDADIVSFVYRDEYYHPEDTDQQGIAEVHVAKQRNGPTGTIKLSFVKRHARFSELAPPGVH